MKRAHRRNINEPGHAHELTFSCYHNLPLLKSELVCRWLAESIKEARRAHRFDLWAYVFMPDHVHMVVWPRRTNYDIADMRKSIKAPVARRAIQHIERSSPNWIPKLTRKRGDRVERLFWQSGGGYDRNITDGRTLIRMIEYIHANPVRKGLVERPRDWKWSSAEWFDNQSEIPISVDPIPPEWLEET